MNTYVLDTSVAVGWYLDEAFSPSARTWQEKMMKGKVVLLVPSLHYWEFANVLRTLVQKHEISELLAREIYELHLEAPLEKAEPDEKKVLDVAFEYGSTAYDAVYISLSLSRGVPLVTAERTTTSWVVKMGDQIEPVR
jgi:predicted nucleic acid-binding protein